MPRYQAPNHSDCYIDCPGEGFAHYISPLGPCRTGCDPSDLGEVFLETVRDGGWEVKSSATVRGITRRQLSELAKRLRKAPPGGMAADAVLDDLERIDSIDGDEKFDASWEEEDCVRALERLRDATGGGRTDGSPMAFTG